MKSKPLTTRRRFFWKAGAALSAPLAVAGAHASASVAEDAEALKARLARLEDTSAIRELHRAYAKRVNAGAHEEIAGLFAERGEALVHENIRGVSADGFEQEDVIEISADRRTATASFRSTVRVESPLEPTCSLVEMALQQGGGVVRRFEHGVFENVYVRRGGVWKIRRLAFRAV